MEQDEEEMKLEEDQCLEDKQTSTLSDLVSSSRPSQCGSLGDPEDCYCDDELHPR